MRRRTVPLPPCRIPDCGDTSHAKGYCRRHYHQLWSTGSPEIHRPNPHGTPEERFWRQVDKREPDECWPWTGRHDKDGYGQLKIGSRATGYRLVRAHRFSYELKHGPFPPAKIARHRCDNPPCCNPDHVIPGTHLENMADRQAAGRYVHGASHPMSKYSDEIVEQVRQAEGTLQSIADRFGMSRSQVGNIRHGRQRTLDVTEVRKHG